MKRTSSLSGHNGRHVQGVTVTVLERINAILEAAMLSVGRHISCEHSKYDSSAKTIRIPLSLTRISLAYRSRSQSVCDDNSIPAVWETWGSSLYLNGNQRSFSIYV
jgi:hypothetical protein